MMKAILRSCSGMGSKYTAAAAKGYSRNLFARLTRSNPRRAASIARAAVAAGKVTGGGLACGVISAMGYQYLLNNTTAASAEGEAKGYDIVKHRRTLRYAFSLAAEEALQMQVGGGRAVGTGYLYTYTNGEEMSEMDVAKLKAKLEQIINSDIPIVTASVPWATAVEYFNKKGLTMSEKLVTTRVSPHVEVLMAGGKMRMKTSELYECMGCLKKGKWSLEKSGKGVLLTYVDQHIPQPALYGSVTSKEMWGVHNGITCVGDLNKLEANNRDRKNFILAAEFMQEAGIVDIVKHITDRADPSGELPSNVRVVCIAGPTSSGKTTFATKLSQQLRNRGMPATPLTVDHYYLPLNRQPKYQARKQRSDVDYDHIESMDIELVNEHIDAVINGKKIMTPKYNMKTGYRDGDGHPFQLPKGGILVIEGIHALNPNYTASIPREKVFKIFLSPITAVSVDEANTIKSTDSRLLRRMSRDYLFRGNSASRTLSMWHNVRRGEGTWIFPFQNEADYVMNSAHEYELCVLKPFVEPLLKGVPPSDANFKKAQELLQLLDKVHSWNERDVPSTSLLREFLGNGVFDEH